MDEKQQESKRMSSFDQTSKPGDRSSSSTIRGSQSYDDDDDDAESQFSYVQSMSKTDLSYKPKADLSYQPPTANTLSSSGGGGAGDISGSSGIGATGGTDPSSSPASSKSASKKLFDEIRDNLDNLNLNLPGFGSRPGGLFQQSNSHNKRESYNSSISQYSGKVEPDLVEPVSVVQVNQQELLKEEEETGLKRGLSLTKVTSKSPKRSDSNIESNNESTPKILQEPNNPISNYTDTNSTPVNNINISQRAPSEASSMALGTLETVHVQHRVETPSSLYSDGDGSGGSSEYASSGRIRDSFVPVVKKKGTRPPDISTNTNIESTVPPRSTRRPKSGIFDEGTEDDNSSLESSSDKKKKRNSKKRMSLSVTDGLDELMRNANNMSLGQPKGSSTSINSGTSKNIPLDNSSQEKLHTEISHDVYMTADDGSSSGASTEFVPLSAQQLQERQFHEQSQIQQQPIPLVSKRNSALPPRPTADNIRKAREVSQQISLKELEDQKSYDESYGGESNEESISGIDRSATLIIPQGKFSENQPLSPAKEVDAKRIFPAEDKALPLPPQEEQLKNPISTEQTQKPIPALVSDSLENDKVPVIDSSPDVSIAQKKETERIDPPLQKSLQGLSSKILPEQQQQNVRKPEAYADNATISTTTTPSIGPNALNALEQDDEYYDIEPVAKPARAKSVKQSINANAAAHPQQPRTQRKSKSHSSKNKKHSSRATSGSLKPFSYQTLISLLESTNGTVIGEEFSQLDLPAKEKQLIEKIIDALSRLSADMVLDRDRYEIGIRRLESALRVLEGFM
ncbi:hypothetical protein CLIB1423_03S02696 [[Candida] railenensis]|uniref:Protein NBA1 n=1 Tax=[Candida] railenensis TaxID=45579 RepID=A0A9P0QMR3_9ASCO|nr:hypothetical protein CLIB1423_03S02696 [[Candida] railenensis]